MWFVKRLLFVKLQEIYFLMVRREKCVRRNCVNILKIKAMQKFQNTKCICNEYKPVWVRGKEAVVQDMGAEVAAAVVQAAYVGRSCDSQQPLCQRRLVRLRLSCPDVAVGILRQCAMK